MGVNAFTKSILRYTYMTKQKKKEFCLSIVICDTPTSMVLCGTASCVQDFDDSQNSAIHITYRISLRSSSSSEPRYPLLKVFFFVIDILVFFLFLRKEKKV